MLIDDMRKMDDLEKESKKDEFQKITTLSALYYAFIDNAAKVESHIEQYRERDKDTIKSLVDVVDDIATFKYRLVSKGEFEYYSSRLYKSPRTSFLFDTAIAFLRDKCGIEKEVHREEKNGVESQYIEMYISDIEVVFQLILEQLDSWQKKSFFYKLQINLASYFPSAYQKRGE